MNRVKTYYSKWYWFITCNRSELAEKIRSELVQFENEHCTQVDLIEVFSFVMAKLFPLSNYVQHKLQAIISQSAAAKTDTDFFTELNKPFKSFVGWYLPEECLVFANVLRSALGREPFTCVRFQNIMGLGPTVVPQISNCLKQKNVTIFQPSSTTLRTKT